MRSYRDLVAWEQRIELAKLLYGLTAGFPAGERFGLVAQIRRAAVSIPSNIAEGQARRSTGEFVQFISYAEGSVAELDTRLYPSLQLGLITSQQACPCFLLLDDLRRMLSGLRRKLSAQS